MPPMLMQHDSDPARDLRDKIGSLDDIEIFGNRILVGVYLRPNKTRSGIMLADVTREEDRYQGKAALVLKKGPSAFVDDATTSFQGQGVDLGDWIAFRPSDGFQITINGVLCRLLEDVNVRVKIPSPDIIY